LQWTPTRVCTVITIGVQGGGGGRPPGFENVQGKLCFQGKR